MPNPETAVELLRAMIAFDSVTPRTSGRRDAERPLAEWLRQSARSWGLRSEWLPIDASLQPGDGGGDLAANLLVWPAASENLAEAGAGWLVFDGHLDTVAIDGMTVSPLGESVSPDDDRVVGRGASDAKGSAAAMLWALKETADRDALSAPVAVLFTVGEEADQIGAQSFARFDTPRLPTERDWKVGGVIVGEPTGMNAVAATGGFLRWRMTTHGVAVHSSRPERGRNAIDDMAHALVTLERDYVAALDARHALVGDAACSVTLIEGGAQHNIVPERCTATIDRRLVPGESAEAELADVTALLDAVSRERLGMRVEHHDVESVPPMELGPNQRLADWAAAALTDAGAASTVCGAPYTTNGNHYAAAGLPCVVLGPGDMAQAHTRDEFLRIADLERGARGYQNLMESWRGGD